MSKLANANPSASGAGRIIAGSVVAVVDSESGERYDVEVIFERDDGVKKPIAVPAARCRGNSHAEKAGWTTQALSDAVSRTLRNWNELYGPQHKWIYHPRKVTSAPNQTQRDPGQEG